MRGGLAAACAAVGPLLGIAWAAGWILKDRDDAWIWLFFIPTPFVILVALVAIALSRRTRFVMALVLAAALARLLAVDMRWHREVPPPNDSLTLVHWNAAHMRFGKQPALDIVSGDSPDLVVLSECPYSAELADLARRHLGFDHVFQDQGMALLSRFPFQPQGTIPMANGRAWWARVETPAGGLELVLTDFLSHPRLDRSLPVARLRQWIDERGRSRPFLIVGDFNTTREARSLAPLREVSRHAYEVAGSGWPYTWPLPLPVYAIDHAWVSDAIRVSGYDLHAAPISDHLRQIIRFTVRADP